jgi:hypothetical protein
MLKLMDLRVLKKYGTNGQTQRILALLCKSVRKLWVDEANEG